MPPFVGMGGTGCYCRGRGWGAAEIRNVVPRILERKKEGESISKSGAIIRKGDQDRLGGDLRGKKLTSSVYPLAIHVDGCGKILTGYQSRPVPKPRTPMISPSEMIWSGLMTYS